MIEYLITWAVYLAACQSACTHDEWYDAMECASAVQEPPGLEWGYYYT
jgi:hypothetical protein